MRTRRLSPWLLGAAAALLLVIAATFALTLRAVDDLRDANRDLRRSLAASAAADRVERFAIDAETGARGFVISGDGGFLVPYAAAVRGLPEALRELDATLPADDGQRELAERAAGRVEAYVDGFASALVALQRRDPAAARRRVAAGSGMRQIAAIRTQFAAFDRAQAEHAAALRAAGDDAARRAVLLALLGLIGCPLLVALLAGALLRRVVGQQAALEQALAALGDQARASQTVLETANDAYLAFDGDGVVLAWSPQAERLYGWTAHEAVGRRLPDLVVPARERARFAHWLRGLLAEAGAHDGQARRYERPACRKDGQELTVELSLAPLRSGDGWRVNVFVRDVTARRMRERAREARVAVSRVLAEVEGRSALVEPGLAALAEAMCWPLAAFWRADAHGRLVCRGLWLEPGGSGLAPLAARTRSTTLDGGASLPAHVWASGASAWAHAAADGLGRGDAALHAGLRIVAATPVGRGAEALGVLEFWQRELTPPSAELFDTLEAIGAQVASIVDKRAAMAEADRLKDEFFALVSHELRTPLTSISGYIELVLDGDGGPLSDEQRRYLEVVARNSQRLQRLVGDLLFVAQVEAGTLRFEHGPVALAEVVRDAVEAARPRADRAGIALDASCEPLPDVVGDRDRLGQLVDNLVSNAIKFTPAGGVVTVRLARRDGHAELAVSDTGIGIPRHERPLLFERFYRASTAVRRELPGVGLGLSICQAIAVGHGGRVEVESETGRGSTFRVLLPLRAAAPDGVRTRRGAAPPPAPS